MKPLRVAVLGQGRSGLDIHCAYLATDPDRFTIAAVVDALPERREKAVRLFGCEVFADYKELFGRTDLDLVVNALPSHFHPDVTIDLLDHGFNVLCEKPMARTPEQADEMIAAAKRAGKMLAIFQQSRFASYFRKVQEVIASGVLGRIVQISVQFDGYARRWDWQTLQEYGAGSLYNTGPHPVDQALELLGCEGMPEIFCKMDRANVFGDAEDYVKLILTAPGCPVVDVEISSCNAYPSHTYNVQGTRGGLVGGMEQMKWKYFKLDEAPEQRLIRTPLMKADGSPAYCAENLIWHADSWQADANDTPFTTAVYRMYTTLVEHLEKGTPLVVTPEQVRRQIAVMRVCHERNPLSTLDEKGGNWHVPHWHIGLGKLPRHGVCQDL